jgi:hypothetical protein
MAICIEDLRPSSPSDRYLRCVAVPGRRPGLGLRADGVVVWRNDDRLACELWVSADDRLIAYRREGAPELVVRRAGRSLAAPTGKPVVLLDQDELEVGGREVRIHVHGVASSVYGPSPLPVRSGTAARITAVAAAAVVLATGAACNKEKAKDGADGSIEVREMPPAPPPQMFPEAGAEDASEAGDAAPDASGAEAGDGAAPGDAGADGSAKAKPKSIRPPPIEVRNHPPDSID